MTSCLERKKLGERIIFIFQVLSIGPGSSYLLDKSSATAASLGPAPLPSMVPVWVLEEAAAEHCLYAGEHYWGTLGLHCGHWVSPVCGSTSTHTQEAGSEDRNVPSDTEIRAQEHREQSASLSPETTHLRGTSD